MQEYVMGNGAIALGALAAGVNLVAGYPGTPSSEIVETISRYPHEGVHLEWSVNEKAAMEVAAGAAYSGARALVTMKQVGLNVAADPLLSLAYVGVKGGMVIVSADDPGPISSQTEQDTRRFADFCRIPVFDPSSPEEAYQMIQDAFRYSEKYKTPVLFRPTTRVCHAYANIENPEYKGPKEYEGFQKDSKKWVIFPKLSYASHARMEERNVEIGKDFSQYAWNKVEGSSSEKAIIASGISYAYAKEYLKNHEDIRLIKIATAYPFPEDFVRTALEGVKEVICLEELSPYIEEQVLKLAGRYKLSIKVSGKLDGKVPHSGENSANLSADILSEFLGIEKVEQGIALSDAPVDTCLCMGAGITMEQGFHWIDGEGTCFGFVGDSTFFASGMTGIVNAVYNNADMILCVLDNSTTAMTGHQPHPGIGRNMMGQIVDKVDIRKVLEGIGVKKILTVDPLNLEEAVAAVRECAECAGVKAIIFKSPCIAISKPDKKCVISDACIQCKKCIREIGCPALITKDGKVTIDRNLCTGCGLCSKICPVNAIGGGTRE